MVSNDYDGYKEIMVSKNKNSRIVCLSNLSIWVKNLAHYKKKHFHQEWKIVVIRTKEKRPDCWQCKVTRLIDTGWHHLNY